MSHTHRLCGNVQYQKYQPKYQPPSAGADNLLIPARQPVFMKIPAPPPHLPFLPHAHMVFCLRNAPDIDAIDCDELISFANRNFIAELPPFQGNEYHNMDWWGNENKLTDDFKAKLF